MGEFGLDFDDASQYIAAQRHGFKSFMKQGDAGSKLRKPNRNTSPLNREPGTGNQEPEVSESDPMNPEDDVLDAIHEAFQSGRVRWRVHAQMRMAERNILRDEVISSDSGGEIIESYREDVPYPSYLVFGRSDGRVLHVVIAWDRVDNTAYVVTVYEPDEELFESDKRTRRGGSRDG